MTGEGDRRWRAGAYRALPEEDEARAYGARRSRLHGFLGGSPASVLVRLLVLSVIVGAGMAMLGLTPGLLFWHAYDAAIASIDLLRSMVGDFWHWVLAGAVVVVPLWLISRFLAMGR